MHAKLNPPEQKRIDQTAQNEIFGSFYVIAFCITFRQGIQISRCKIFTSNNMMNIIQQYFLSHKVRPLFCNQSEEVIP